MQLASNYLVITIIIMIKISVSSCGTQCLNCKNYSYDAAPSPTFDTSARSVNSNKFNQVIGGGRFIQMKRNRQCQKNFIGIKRHPFDTKLYYICRQNSIILAKCDETQFSEKFKHCVATKNQTKTSTDTMACSMSGIYPDPRDTRYYYTCVFYKRHFIKRNYKCSDHNVFNATKKKCVEIAKPSSCSTTENCSSEGEYMPKRNWDIKPPHKIFKIIKKKKNELVKRLPYSYKPTEFIDFSSTEDSRYNEDFLYLTRFNSKNKGGTKRSRQCNCSNCRTRSNKYYITGRYTDERKHENVAETPNGMNGEGINDDELSEPENGTGNDENFDIYKASQNDHTIGNDRAITKNDQTSNNGNKDIDEGDLKTEIENGSNIGTTQDNKSEKETEKNFQIGENGEPNAKPESLSGDNDNNMKIRSDNSKKFSNSGSNGEQNKRDKNVGQYETVNLHSNKNGNIASQNEKNNDGATENENGDKASSSDNTRRTNNVKELVDTKRNNFTNPDTVNINVSSNDEITHSANQPRTNTKNSISTTKSNEQTDSKDIGDTATDLSKPESNATDKGQEAEKDTTLNTGKATSTDKTNDVIIVKGVNESVPNNEKTNANHHGAEQTDGTRKFKIQINGNANNRNADGSEVINEYAEGNNHEREETYPADGTLTENQSDSTKDRNDTGNYGKSKTGKGDKTDKEIVLNKAYEDGMSTKIGDNGSINNHEAEETGDIRDVQSQNSDTATENRSEIDLQENQSSADVDTIVNATSIAQKDPNAITPNHNTTEMREQDNENTREAKETGNITKPINNTTKEAARNNATYEGRTEAEAKGATVNHGNDNGPSDNENKTKAEVDKGTYEQIGGNTDNDSEIKNENKNDLGTSENGKPRETDPKENQTFVVKSSDDNDPRTDKNTTANGGTETSNDGYSGNSSGSEVILRNKQTEDGADADKRQDGTENDNMEDSNNLGGSDNQINGNEDQTAGANFDPSNEPLINNDQSDRNTNRPKEVDVVPQKIGEIDNGAKNSKNNKDTLTEIEKRSDPTTWNMLENGVAMPNNINPDIGEDSGTTSDQMTDIKTVNANITTPFMDNEPEIVNRTDTETSSTGADEYPRNNTAPNIENKTVLENNDASNADNEYDGVRVNKDTKGFEKDKKVDTTGMDKVIKSIYTNKDETDTAHVLNNQNNKDPESNDATVDNEPDGVLRNEDNRGFEEVKDIGTEAEGTDGINEGLMTDKVSELEDLSGIKTDTTGTNGDNKGIIGNKEKTDTRIQPTSNIENKTVSETNDASNVDNKPDGVRENGDNKGFGLTEPEAETNGDLVMTDKAPENESRTDIFSGSTGANEDTEGENANKGEIDTVSQTIPNYENKTNEDNKDFEDDKETDRGTEPEVGTNGDRGMTDKEPKIETLVGNDPDGVRGNEDKKGFEEDQEADRGTEPDARSNGDLGMTDKEPEIETLASNEPDGVRGNEDNKGFEEDKETDRGTEPEAGTNGDLGMTDKEPEIETLVGNEPDGVRGNEDKKGFEEGQEADRGTEPDAGTNGDLGMTDKKPEIEARTDILSSNTGANEDAEGKNVNKGEIDTVSQNIPNYENKTNEDNKDFEEDKETDRGTEPEAGTNRDLGMTEKEPKIETLVGNEPDGVRGNEDNKGFEEDQEADRGTEPDARTNGDLGMTDKEPLVGNEPDGVRGNEDNKEFEEDQEADRGTEPDARTNGDLGMTDKEPKIETLVGNEPDGVRGNENNKGFEEDMEADRGTEPNPRTNGDLGMTDKKPEIEARTDILSSNTGANEDDEGKNANKGEIDTVSQNIPNYENKTNEDNKDFEEDKETDRGTEKEAGTNGDLGMTEKEPKIETLVGNEPDGFRGNEDNKEFEEDQEADRGTEPDARSNGDLGMTDKEPKIETLVGNDPDGVRGNEDKKGFEDDQEADRRTEPDARSNGDLGMTDKEPEIETLASNEPDGVRGNEDNKGFEEDKETDRGTEPEAGTNGDLGMTDKEPEIETLVGNEPDGVRGNEDKKGFEEGQEADRGTEPDAGTNGDLGMTDKKPEIEAQTDILSSNTGANEDAEGKNVNKGEIDTVSQNIPNYENKTNEDNKDFEEDKETDRGTEPEAGTNRDLGMTDKEPKIETLVGNEPDGVRGNEDNKGFEEDQEADRGTEPDARTNGDLGMTDKEPLVGNEPDGVRGNEDNKEFEEDQEADRGTEPDARTNGDLGMTDKEPKIETLASNEPDGVRGNEDNKGFEEDMEADRGTEPEAGTNGDLGMTDKEPKIETLVGNESDGVRGNEDKKWFEEDQDANKGTEPDARTNGDLGMTNREPEFESLAGNEPDGVRGNEDIKGFEEDKEADKGTEPEAGTNGDLEMTNKEPEIDTRTDIENGDTGANENNEGKNANKGEIDTVSQTIPNYENNTVSGANNTSLVGNEPDGVQGNEDYKGFEEDKEADRGTEPEAGTNGDLEMTNKEPEIDTRTDIGNDDTGANENTEGNNANKGETETSTQTIPNYENKTIPEPNDTSNVDNEPDRARGNEDNKGFEEEKEIDRKTEGTETEMDGDAKGITNIKETNTVLDSYGASNVGNEFNKNQENVDDQVMNKEAESDGKTELANESGKQLQQRNRLLEVTVSNGASNVGNAGLADKSGKQLPQEKGLVELTAALPRTFVSPKTVVNMRVF